MNELLMSVLAATGGTDTDPNFNNVVLLLNGDGTANGSQNGIILDQSANTHGITKTGTVLQGSFSPFSKEPGKWSTYFSGTSGATSVQYASNAAFNFGTGDFTVEGWFYLTLKAIQTFWDFRTAASQAAGLLYTDGSGFLQYYVSGAIRITYAVDVPLNKWHHIAVSRASGTTRMFLNGAQVGSNYTDGTTYIQSPFYIGATIYSPGTYFNGYISNIRILKGTGLYTTTYIPSTTPLTAITNTQLLTCRENYFKDNSTNNFASTRTGTPAISPFSPFVNLTEYVYDTGSAYFNSTSTVALENILQTPSTANLDISTGDFTVECWAYPTAVQNFSRLVCFNSTYTTGSVGMSYQTATGKYAYYLYDFAQYQMTSDVSYELYRWTHLAFTRSGSTFKMFVDGVTANTYTNAGDLFATTTPFVSIGCGTTSVGGFSPTQGWITGVRVVKGTSLYNSDFARPTSIPTNVANTRLLCNFTNAGIADFAKMNSLDTIGNAQIRTNIKKYNSGSIFFDGSGDYLQSNPRTTELYTFGNGDFTIECWAYFNVVTGTQVIYDSRPLAQGAYPTIYTSTTSLLYFINSLDRITATAALAATTWYHIAVCKSGTSTKMFLNGTQVGSTYTDNNVYLNGANRPVIGITGIDVSGGALNGYLDDLRVTKGIARYTANFTAPTRPFRGM